MVSETLRLLIVDDDEEQLRMVRRLMRLEGFEVITTAASIGSSNIVRSQRPDAILLDVHIPALSGDKLLPLLRQAHPQTRIFLYSADDPSLLRVLAAETKADGWISKSEAPSEIASKIRRAITRSSGVMARPTDDSGFKGTGEPRE